MDEDQIREALAHASLMRDQFLLCDRGRREMAESHMRSARWHMEKLAGLMGCALVPLPVREQPPADYVLDPGPHNVAPVILDGTVAYRDGAL